MTAQILTQKYLKSILHYDPDTGVFTWKIRPIQHFKTHRSYARFNNHVSGNITGTINAVGYAVIRINGVLYSSHRLAFLYMTGVFPKEGTDHIDHCRSNNKWMNLREASQTENMRNASIFSHNSSGFSGVCWDKKRSKWMAYINISKKCIHGGRFIKLSDAVLCRIKLESKYNFHANHGI